MRYQLFAPAKINLDLHITGTRADGYHTLHSHVAFADCGDDLTLDISVSATTSCQLKMDGAFAWHLKGLPSVDNLVSKAVMAFSALYNFKFNADIVLTKHLPSGAGMGGGSADAAAVLRALVKHFAVDDSAPEFQTLCLSLGADLPVCYASQSCLMQGIGEILSPWEMHNMPAVLIWPGVGGSTQDLYRAYDSSPQKAANNDFQTLAIPFCPAIQDALNWLESQPNCQKASLTGSGTAVFGLFPTPLQMDTTPDFPWVQHCIIGPVKKPLVTAQNSR